MAGPKTWGELITQLNAILDNFAGTVGADVVSSNVSGATDFSKGVGSYVNSPSTPLTDATIPLNTTDAVRGGFSSIWYKGPVLNKNSFTGGTVTMFSGVNVLNELCRIFIDYDMGGEAFSISIQTGFTGDLPSGVPDTTPPATMDITNVEATDPTPPATMEITLIT